MSDRRWAIMFAQMSSLALYPAKLDYRSAYTLRRAEWIRMA